MADRFLMIGETGQLARALAAKAAGAGVELITLGRAVLDLRQTGAVRPAILEAAERQPVSAIVNAAAYTAVDRAESEEDVAFRVNAAAPREMAAAAAELGVPLLHVSTDYVFDGSKGAPYRENDPPNPLSVYGRSKLAGERAVQETCAHHIIVRTAWVYGPVGQNFFNTMLRLGRERDVLKVVADQQGSPTTTGDLASALLALGKLAQAPAAERGVFHYVSSGETNWFGFAKEIFRNAAIALPNVKWAEVAAIRTEDYPTAAVRPRYSVLSTQRIELAYDIRPRAWDVALQDVVTDWTEAQG